MAFTDRVWSAGKVLMLIGALAATYVLSAFAGMRIAVQTREVTVPRVIGTTLNTASALLAESGLALRVEGERPHTQVAAGHILSQTPEPGVTLRRQRSVKVWVSQGPRTAVVPSLIGQTERTAQLRLTDEGLKLGSLAEIRSSDYPTEAIIAQRPGPGSQGSTIALLMNRGERGNTYVMPDLIGVNGTQAADILRDRGFRVAVVGSQPYPGVPPGIIIRQSPQAGFQIAPGEPISVEVSR